MTRSELGYLNELTMEKCGMHQDRYLVRLRPHERRLSGAIEGGRRKQRA